MYICNKSGRFGTGEKMASNKENVEAMSDMALLGELGNFVKQNRLEQNKTQGQLSEEAGISRSALFDLEKGRGSSTVTLVQVLRALKQLGVWKNFQFQTQVSPLQLAKLERKKRKRASGTLL